MATISPQSNPFSAYSNPSSVSVASVSAEGLPTAQAQALANQQQQLKAQAQDTYRSLSIASWGPATLENSKIKTYNFQTRETNRTTDIEGSAHIDKFARFSNKYANIQEPDPQTIRAKPAIHSRNTRDLSLYIDDIEGTRCVNKDRMALTKRRVNPMNPDYPLPAFVHAEPEPPKFIRDELYFDDIEGSRSKPLYKPYTRDIISVTDIEGTTSGWKPRNEMVKTMGVPRELLRTEDVSTKTHRYVDRTQRHGDVLDPRYVVHGSEIADDPKYTKPKPIKQYIPENHLLMTNDIPGATTKWKESQPHKQLREIRNVTSTQDIQGAQADTLKHTIVTKRQTNPLLPVYQTLDDGEALPPIVAPLLSASLITRPNIKYPAGYVSNSMPSEGSGRPSSSMRNHNSSSSSNNNNNKATSVFPSSNNNSSSLNFGEFNFNNANANSATANINFGNSSNPFDVFSSSGNPNQFNNNDNKGNSNNSFDLFQMAPSSGAVAANGTVSFATKFDDVGGLNFNANNGNSNNNNSSNLLLDFGNIQQPPSQLPLGSNNLFNNNSNNNRITVTSARGGGATGGAGGAGGVVPRSQSAHMSGSSNVFSGNRGVSTPSPRSMSAGRRIVAAEASPRAANNNSIFGAGNGNANAMGSARGQGQALGIAERKAARELQAEIDAIRNL